MANEHVCARSGVRRMLPTEGMPHTDDRKQPEGRLHWHLWGSPVASASTGCWGEKTRGAGGGVEGINRTALPSSGALVRDCRGLAELVRVARPGCGVAGSWALSSYTRTVLAGHQTGTLRASTLILSTAKSVLRVPAVLWGRFRGVVRFRVPASNRENVQGGPNESGVAGVVAGMFGTLGLAGLICGCGAPVYRAAASSATAPAHPDIPAANLDRRQRVQARWRCRLPPRPGR